MDEVVLQRLIERTEILCEVDDWSSIEDLWRPYIEDNDVEAQFRLAYYYLFYSFPEEPETRAEMKKLLQMAADRGHPDAVYHLCHFCQSDMERDALLLRAGELGSRDAQRDLGAYYATGDWTGPRDETRGAAWYRRAADRGHADAQYNLGFMYLLGQGVPSDPVEGLRLLRLSADQGEECAYGLLADVYRNGYYGVPIDLAEATRFDKLKATGATSSH